MQHNLAREREKQEKVGGAVGLKGQKKCAAVYLVREGPCQRKEKARGSGRGG